MSQVSVRYIGGIDEVDVILSNTEYVTVARGEVVEVEEEIASSLLQQSIFEPANPAPPAGDPPSSEEPVSDTVAAEETAKTRRK